MSAMWETWVRSLGQEDALERGMATHSSTLACRIPWTEEPEELQSLDTTERPTISLSLCVNVLPLQSESSAGLIPGNCKQTGCSPETDRMPPRKQTGLTPGNRQDAPRKQDAPQETDRMPPRKQTGCPQETDRTRPRKQTGCPQETGCTPGNRQEAPQETHRTPPRKQTGCPQETGCT